jgi:4-carboxymuconolactone decarboxylase
LRVADLAYDELSDEQRRLYDAIAATHGGKVGGPFTLWLRSPAIGEAMDSFRNALRGVDLTPTMHEVLTLVVARHWKASYPWSVHAEHTSAAGLLSAQQLAALADGTTPAFDSERDAQLHALVTELLETGGLTDDSFADAISAFGERLMLDVVMVVSFYTAACLTANAFAQPPVAAVPAAVLDH